MFLDYIVCLGKILKFILELVLFYYSGLLMGNKKRKIFLYMVGKLNLSRFFISLVCCCLLFN